MEAIKKQKEKTPKRDKIIGRITTVLAVVSSTISMSGLIDNKPVLKTILDILTGILAKKSLEHGMQTEENI